MEHVQLVEIIGHTEMKHKTAWLYRTGRTIIKGKIISANRTCRTNRTKRTDGLMEHKEYAK